MIIEVYNLMKNYYIKDNKKEKSNFFSTDKKLIKAVEDVSFSIEKGEIIGYIGPNGAGKSTTIKMLSGVLKPDGGRVLVNGKDPFKMKKSFYKDIGIMFGQKSQLWWDLPVIESYKLLSMIYDVSEKEFKDRISLFSDYLQIDELLHRQVKKLSLGQRVLCDLAAIFIHNPKIVFLDEPTIGLDISIKNKIHRFINHMNIKYETTFILTSHDIFEIEKLSTRVFLIDGGKLIFSGTTSELKKLYSNDECNMAVEFKEMIDKEELERCLDEFNVQIKLINDLKFDISYNQNNIDIGQIISSIEKCGVINDIAIKGNDIETIILRLYDKSSVR